MSIGIPLDTAVSPGIDEPLYEIIDGQRVEVPPMGAFEGGLASRLSYYLNSCALQSIGQAVVEVLFELPNITRQRRPDVSFVRYDRFPIDRQIPLTNAWAIVPNLAVEVVSRTNTVDEIGDKIADYFKAGVSLVWVILPRQEQIHVYTSPKTIRGLDQTDVLDGGTVIPGFNLPVATLFLTGRK